MTSTYKESGVDIDAGSQFIKNIIPLIRTTRRRGVIGDVGGFGGFFAPDLSDMEEPVLVAGTDGVGTKLKIAIELRILNTMGIDLVAMCVNDIACSGAEPLFFLDYFATPKLRPTEHTAIIEGIAKACAETKCALIGGETAELPDLYHEDDFDLAGFAVGVVDRKKIIDGSDIGAGNSIIGIFSSGFHSNGFSLVRKIVRDAGLNLAEVYAGIEKPLGLALLEPTKLYSPLIGSLKRDFVVKGIAHITGGGFWDNIPRILPPGAQAVIKRDSWTVPRLFEFFQEMGGIADNEMLRVFNCGIGMVIVVDADKSHAVIDAIKAHGHSASIIGQTQKRSKNEDAIVIE